MIIIKSTSDFKIKGYPIPDFPLLTWSTNNDILGIEAGMLFNEGLEFLTYECLKRGRVKSKKTWDTYAKHLVSFFTFCEDNDQDWRYIEDDGIHEMLLAVYRDSCQEDFCISSNSTNQHLRTIVRFYIHAVGRGWVNSLPYSLEDVKANQNQHSFLAHTVTDGGITASVDIMLKTKKTSIKFLQVEETKELLNAIKNPTLKLMTRLCLQTGIRKKELLLFPLDVIRKPRAGELLCRVDIDRTKGEHERSIDIPPRLMEDLWRYVNTTRFQQEEDSGVKSEYLFLTSSGEEWEADGDGFNKALKALKLPFKVNPHKLRHTYATHMLKGLLKANNIKFSPLMYIQARLGHSSLTTTMKYLHLVNDLLDDVTIEYQDAINELEAA
jgi:site-specific recombinase XerD